MRSTGNFAIRRFNQFPLRAFPVLAALAALPGCVGPERHASARRAAVTRPTRAIWITRFDYRTADDVRRIIANCADLGLNTLLFQVRGNGTAFYRSALEPWADELGGRDPGFDPLELACKEAHARGLMLHAWVNVMPAWRGTTPPSDPNQLYLKHPDWFWYDQHGARQALSSFYVSLNPCLPDVRRYLADVCGDLVARYPVDGLHLDYIRFPNEPPATPADSGIDYPRDARTLALFLAERGATPESDPAAWSRWRADCVTRTVREIGDAVWRRRPRLPLTAAVGPVPDRALAHHFQDGRRWLREGLVDALLPMNYTDEVDLFDKRLTPYLADSIGPIIPGIRSGRGDDRPGGPPDNDSTTLRRQIEIALRRTPGFCIFAYGALFDDLANDNGKISLPRTNPQRTETHPSETRRAQMGQSKERQIEAQAARRAAIREALSNLEFAPRK